jgi:hypothetical protein
VLIPYKFLIPLLVFVLLTGVVIGDRLAAEARFGGSSDGHSGACSGLASAHLHNCVHRQGSFRAAEGRPGQSGGTSGCPDCWDRSLHGREAACGNELRGEN